MATGFNAALSAMAVIANNICNQVIAFQNAISGREIGHRFPTEKETTLLCKLINCLDKLRKMAAPHKAQQAMQGFISFLAAEDKEFSKTVAAKYKAYMAATATTGFEFPDQEHEVPPTPPPSVYEQPAAQTPQQNNALQGQPAIASFPATEQADVPGDMAPFSKEDFEQYKSLLNNVGMGRQHQSLFKGVMHNTDWLQYNLFQYCLPPGERKFFADEQNYHTQIDYYETCERIQRYFRDEEH